MKQSSVNRQNNKRLLRSRRILKIVEYDKLYSYTLVWLTKPTYPQSTLPLNVVAELSYDPIIGEFVLLLPMRSHNRLRRFHPRDLSYYLYLFDLDLRKSKVIGEHKNPQRNPITY